MGALIITNPAARPVDKAANRSVDAPPGVQHLENFAKLLDLAGSDFAPSAAAVKADDTVLLDAGHRPPAPVGTLSTPAAVSRVSHTFTPRDYSSSVEFAPPLAVRSSPFDVQPVLAVNAAGAVSIELSTKAQAVTDWPGYVLALFASGSYIATHSACPQNGHLVPETAEGRIWLPPLPNPGRFQATFTGYSIPDTGEFVPLTPGLYYNASIYLTRSALTALPPPGTTRDLLSYPSATLAWIQE